jgi:putative DNA primase/helicase
VGLDDYLLQHSTDEFAQLKHEKVSPRTCFRNESGSLNYYGVKNDMFEKPVKIAAAIEVRAYTRDDRNEAWGILLRFKDKDNINHSWAMPMELLSGDGSELRSKLYEMGLPYISIGRKHRHLLLDYLQKALPDNGLRARCVDRTGWHNEKLFVLPVGSIGTNGDETIVYQGKTDPVIFQKGSVQDWIDNVGTYCTGNSRLLFSVSMSFVAPLLYTISAENFGANVFGSSSTGKTTGLKVACSIWGGRDYMLRWRATGNGLEGIATAHNDLFMGLDELAQVSSNEAGEIANMLANGVGKSRANQDGEARASKKWRTCFLSTGEITLSEHVASSGKKIKAGQEVRLVDIPADTGKHGLFEELHGLDNGAKLSQHLNSAVGEYYGAVGIAYLKQVIEDAQELPSAIRKERAAFVASVCPKGADGQVSRVAGFFGLVAAAGEYATINQLTGWQEGYARNAAATCFKAWLDNRGGSGAKEVDRILEDLRMFIENHGDSRFALKDGTDTRTIVNRAGFRDNEYYYILPETFKREILKGHNFSLAKKELIERGVLAPGDSDSRHTKKMRLPCGNTNAYVICADRLSGAGES